MEPIDHYLNFLKIIGKRKLKIVTHHWSSHHNKGAEIYTLLDDLLNEKLLKKRIKFTYIGNSPKGIKFNNTKLIKPLYGKTS